MLYPHDSSVADIEFVAFDFETTGLVAGKDRIVELGAVRFKGIQELGSFQAIVNPGIPISAEVVSIHGITTEMVSGKPTLKDVLPDFLGFIKDSVLIAHNAAFDTGFLRAALLEEKLPDIDNIILDTKDIAKRVFPGERSYGLQNLIAGLGIKTTAAHRALEDAKMCMKLFQREVEAMSFLGELSLSELL